MNIEDMNTEQFKQLLRSMIVRIQTAEDPYDMLVAYRDIANQGMIGYLPHPLTSRFNTMLNDKALVRVNDKWELGKNLEDYM
jgi:hypothetical protein